MRFAKFTLVVFSLFLTRCDSECRDIDTSQADLILKSIESGTAILKGDYQKDVYKRSKAGPLNNVSSKKKGKHEEGRCRVDSHNTTDPKKFTMLICQEQEDGSIKLLEEDFDNHEKFELETPAWVSVPEFSKGGVKVGVFVGETDEESVQLPNECLGHFGLKSSGTWTALKVEE